jgi:hypothetical protein
MVPGHARGCRNGGVAIAQPAHADPSSGPPETPLVRGLGWRRWLLAHFLGAAPLDLALDHRDIENPDVKAIAAIAAAHRVAESQQKYRIEKMKAGKAQISGTAVVAVDSHLTFVPCQKR